MVMGVDVIVDIDAKDLGMLHPITPIADFTLRVVGKSQRVRVIGIITFWALFVIWHEQN